MCALVCVVQLKFYWETKLKKIYHFITFFLKKEGKQIVVAALKCYICLRLKLCICILHILVNRCRSCKHARDNKHVNDLEFFVEFFGTQKKATRCEKMPTFNGFIVIGNCSLVQFNSRKLSRDLNNKAKKRQPYTEKVSNKSLFT